MQRQPRIVDLFCGCGGFSLGAEAAGLPSSLAFDVDPILTSSFALNHPGTALHLADLSKVEGKEIEQRLGGPVDGIFGGPPCQAFSAMGHRKAEDPRRTLLGHFFRLVAETRPAFFVMENVKGLGFPDARPVLDQAIDQLSGKYQVLGPVILDAADFGAATRRQRMFVIGYDADRIDPITLADIESKKRKPASVRSAIGDLSTAVQQADDGDFDVWKIRQRGKPSQYAAGLRAPDSIFTGHRRTVHSNAVVKRFKKVVQGGVDPVGRHARLDWQGQCPTLRAGTGSDLGSYQSVRPIHPEEPRVITVREGARLQGFPDRFKFHPTVWHSFRMIGNSVSPIMSEAIFSVIAERLGYGGSLREAAE